MRPTTNHRPIERIEQLRNHVSAQRPYHYFVESELNRAGAVESVGTIFLTNRQCPFQCVMCDLWKNTLQHAVAPGQIPGQIQWAQLQLSEHSSVKLYNSGNFFDRKAIPISDYAAIAELVRKYDTVIVENHPKLCGQACLEFAKLIQPAQLEVALGLETCHTPSLNWLSKSMTLGDFGRAAEYLQSSGIRSRVFLLLGLPFMTKAAYVDWTLRSIEFAAGLAVDCISVIPMRYDLPPLDDLKRSGDFHPPDSAAIESLLDGASGFCGRLFIDLWDVKGIYPCSDCREQRVQRLERFNLTQVVEPDIVCGTCSAFVTVSTPQNLRSSIRHSIAE